MRFKLGRAAKVQRPRVEARRWKVPRFCRFGMGNFRPGPGQLSRLQDGAPKIAKLLEKWLKKWFRVDITIVSRGSIHKNVENYRSFSFGKWFLKWLGNPHLCSSVQEGKTKNCKWSTMNIFPEVLGTRSHVSAQVFVVTICWWTDIVWEVSSMLEWICLREHFQEKLIFYGNIFAFV